MTSPKQSGVVTKPSLPAENRRKFNRRISLNSDHCSTSAVPPSAEQRLPYGAPIGLNLARKIIDAALLEARKMHWPVCVAILDTGGHLVALERMDNVQFMSVKLAQDKAFAAIGFRRPTRAWSEALLGGRQAVLGIDRVVPAEGGLPIIVGNVIVGSIGVSGVASKEDEHIALAGLAVLS